MLWLESIVESLPKYEARLGELTARMTRPELLSNPAELKKVGKERHRLQTLVDAIAGYASSLKRLAEAREVIAEGADAELVELAHAEEAEIAAALPAAERELQLLLLPPDPNEDKNALLEIRAGTGGEEAALFAGELMRMYLRYAERRGWKTEILSMSESGIGGIKEVIVRVTGDAVNARLKFESGVHRVQRVPETEASGRIHTSAASVVMMPEADEIDVELRTEELKIDVFRASGAGGQHVNKTESGVRITHIPTGTVVSCQDERSQHKNRQRAMVVLRSRIYDVRLRKQQETEAALRRSQVSSADRSAKIRTYNFPQGRVTDHRIKVTLHRLQEFLDGDLDEMSDALMLADAQERLESVSAKG